MGETRNNPGQLSGVYQILNTANGKQYIGSAAYINKRWGEHRNQLGKGRHHSIVLQRAWDKYGAQSFSFNLLLFCHKTDLLFYEQLCFDKFHPAYNISPTAGSLLGYKTSAETKAKLSAALKGRPKSEAMRIKLGNAHRGKTISPEARAKMSAAKIGKKLSDGVRANMSVSVRARGTEYHARLSASKIGNKNSLGRKHPPEVLAKISAASLAMWERRRGV